MYMLGECVKGTVLHVASDNLAAHSLAGFFKSFMVDIFCRFFMARRDEMQAKAVNSGSFELRSIDFIFHHRNTCVRAAEDNEPFLQLSLLVVECESQQQFHLINGPHKRFWFPCTHHFRLLVMLCFSVYCLFTVCKLNAHAPSLILCFW